MKQAYIHYYQELIDYQTRLFNFFNDLVLDNPVDLIELDLWHEELEDYPTQLIQSIETITSPHGTNNIVRYKSGGFDQIEDMCLEHKAIIGQYLDIIKWKMAFTNVNDFNDETMQQMKLVEIDLADKALEQFIKDLKT